MKPKQVFIVGQNAFVQVLRGIWLRTNPCVAFVPCDVCGVKVGQCCLGAQGQPHGDTHAKRRTAWVHYKRRSGGAVGTKP